MENFFWTLGGMYELPFGYSRRMLTTVGNLITVIDDIYDIYGTLDELQLFTDAVERFVVLYVYIISYQSLTFLYKF